MYVEPVLDQLSYPLDLIAIVRGGEVPLHKQLCDQLRELISAGDIQPGTQLPSTRTMAAELQISRNTVISALDQLAAEGLLMTRPGSGVRVARVTQPRKSRALCSRDIDVAPGLSVRGQLMVAQPRIRSIPARIPFHPGTPELAQFPFAKWSKLLATRARFGGQDLFGYHYVQGHPDLRQMIASFLSTMRRVRCTADQIVVTTGGQAALDLLARLLLSSGDHVWMEEPGYMGARSAFLGAGGDLVPLRVERDGWHLPGNAARPRLIYLTPSCHHPLGVTMPLEQRLAVLDVAAAANAWIIEDDFDGEYTFRGEPLPAMQGLTEPARVIYVGTFAKTLFPAMRLGFIVLPGRLAEEIKPAIALTGQFPPLILQATLADFIAEGHFFLHLNRMRRLYAQRRKHFLRLLARHLSRWLDPIDGRTGIQIAALLKAPFDDDALARAAATRHVNVAPLSAYHLGDPHFRGLLMGYAGVPEAEMDRAFPILEQVFEEFSR